MNFQTLFEKKLSPLKVCRIVINQNERKFFDLRCIDGVTGRNTRRGLFVDADEARDLFALITDIPKGKNEELLPSSGRTLITRRDAKGFALFANRKDPLSAFSGLYLTNDEYLSLVATIEEFETALK